MRKALIIGLVMTVVASLSLFAAAASNDYSLENGDITSLTRTVTYGWDLETDFVGDTSVASGDSVDGYFTVVADRSVDSDVLSFDVNLDVVADGNEESATVESVTVEVQADTNPHSAKDWETVATYTFDPGNTVGVDDTDPLDPSFDLDLSGLSEADRDTFDGADGYRLLVTVAMDEGGDTFDLTDSIAFELPDETDEVDAEAVFETDPELDTDFEVDGVTNDPSDWDYTVEDDSISGSIDLSLTAADGSYTVPIDVSLYGDDTDDPIVETTRTLHLTFGDVVPGDQLQEQDRDRDAWAEGHPVHGIWMPPVKDGMELNSNRTLPVKFWLPEGEYDTIGLAICPDPDDVDDDCVADLPDLVQTGGGMYQAVIHLKDYEWSEDTYYLVITEDGDPIDLDGYEYDPMSFTVMGKGGGKPADVGVTNNGNTDKGPANGRGHGKDK